MRCYICDQQLLLPKDDDMTGKFSPCDACQKVIDELIFEAQQPPSEDFYDPNDPDNLLLEDDWDAEYEQIDLECMRFKDAND